MARYLVTHIGHPDRRVVRRGGHTGSTGTLGGGVSVWCRGRRATWAEVRPQSFVRGAATAATDGGER
jgi:hypothetical protein